MQVAAENCNCFSPFAIVPTMRALRHALNTIFCIHHTINHTCWVSWHRQMLLLTSAHYWRFVVHAGTCLGQEGQQDWEAEEQEGRSRYVGRSARARSTHQVDLHASLKLVWADYPVLQHKQLVNSPLPKGLTGKHSFTHEVHSFNYGMQSLNCELWNALIHGVHL